MAVSVRLMGLIVAFCGAVSFIFGVVAENKKPAAGTPITGKGVVICKYSSDPTVVLGYLSVAFLIATTVAGYLSLFYPYKGKSVPQSALFRSTSFVVFFNIAMPFPLLSLSKGLWVEGYGEGSITGGGGVWVRWCSRLIERAIEIKSNLGTPYKEVAFGELGGDEVGKLDTVVVGLVVA
ncbi:uncharacterized protein LOC132190103 [Corylus avellana]|uniref:uncharacterized protein LOC132190103 n=1 Tax=Corylus avellana TaxID=13451 RepID=UPI00286C4E2D|nr:uncharacterized protein LOC132190103 [Corylus avellana]